MGSQPDGNLLPVVMLRYEPSLWLLMAEVLPLEGYDVQQARTDVEVRSLLDSHGGTCIVLMDNLHVHREGQQFLTELRQNPGLRARVKTVSMAAVNDWIRQDFGDVLDAYLAMPFTVPQLLNTLASL